MRFFDLHCDTVYRVVKEKGSIFKNNFHVSIEKSKIYDSYLGCFAVWIPEDLSGERAFEFFKNCKKTLDLQVAAYKNDVKKCKSFKDLENTVLSEKSGIILTVEGSAALGGKLSNLEYMSRCGVKIMTLTWNHRCDAGDGVGVLNPSGITNFGKKLVKELERYDIIVDVAHASEKLFYDVLEIAEKPIIATHCNSKKICDNKRNLSDEQIKVIKERNGLIGMTFCKDFLSSSEKVGFEDILRHTEHFLSLSCEDVLSIGSDFDGSEVPKDICGLEKLKNLYEYFLIKNYKRELLDKIFFKNAYDFMKRFC